MGKRYIDFDVILTNEFFFCSEETAIATFMLKSFEWELYENAMPFSTKARIYNDIFDYSNDTAVGSKRKR